MRIISRAGATKFVLPVVVFLLLALPPAGAVAGAVEELPQLPTLDSLNRSESPLSNGGKWTTLNWATAAGQDTIGGWGPSAAFPAVNGAYWNPTFVDGRYGDAASLTMLTAPATGQYVSIWLNMPSPGSAKSGYQLRWTANAEAGKYTVKLSKWVSGAETVLASNPEVALPVGTTLAIVDSGGAVHVWRSENGTTFTGLLLAGDSTYQSGYAGIEASGNVSRSTKFKAGPMVGSAAASSPVLDNLERSEVPLATSNWTKTSWAAAIGGTWIGSYRGYGSSGALAGTYWNSNTVTDEGGAALVAATVGTGATPAGQYLGLWLDMPSPGSARSGYEARFIGTNGTATAYKVELSKWVAGTRTVLATKEGFSLPVGMTMALTDNGSGVVVWAGNGATLTPVLTATDTTYSSGYTGLEVNGGAGTMYNFRAGSLGLAPETTITAGPSGSVQPQSVIFTFSSSIGGSTFGCSLDGAAYATCTSPKSYPTITEGAHTFRVRATDSSGNTDPTPAERSFTVVMPPTVTTKPAAGIKNNQATLTADVNPRSSATTYQFEWGTSTAYGNVVPATAKSAGSGSAVVEVSEPLAGLTPDTEYHYRISATNANGTSKGADKAFVTGGPPVATTDEATGVSANEATLKASLNPHGAATTYYFEYGPTSAYGSKAPATPASGGSGYSTGGVVQTVTGLSEGSDYHYRVVVQNEYGTVKGADRTFTTPLMPEAVTEGSEAVEANDAILTGSIDPNGEDTSYQFEYGTTTSYGSTVALGTGMEAGSGPQPVEVMAAPTYLQPETTYHYRVVAKSDAGKDLGVDKTVTTGARVMTAQEEAARAAQDDAFTSSQATLPDSFVGLMWSGDDRIESNPAEMEVIYNSGAKMLRWPVNVDYLTSEAAWEQTETVFKEAAERGIRILPNLDGGQDLVKEGRAAEWRAFIAKAIERLGYNGKVWGKTTNDLPPTWWEVGNENNYYKWNPGEIEVNPELFGKYIRISAEALDAASTTDPDQKVVLGGLISANIKIVENPQPGVEVNKQLPVAEFIETMKEGRGYFDALGLHPYAFLSDGHEPRTTAQVKDVREKVRTFIAEARNALDRIGASSKQIWITELGWPVEAPTDAGHPHVQEDEQAELISYSFSMIMNRASQFKIAHVLYYNHRDHPDGNTAGSPWYNWAYQCGLRKNNGEFRQSWWAFRKQAFKDDNYPRNPGAKTKGNNPKAKKSGVFAEVNPEGLSTTFYFQYERLGSGTIQRTGDKFAGYKQGFVNVSDEATGLTPKQKYRYRVIAVNANNMVEPGLWAEFETPPSSSTSSTVERILHGTDGYVWVEGWVKEGYITGPGPGLAGVHVHVKIFRNGAFQKFRDVVTNSEGHYDSGYIQVGKGTLETETEFPGGLEWDPSTSNREPFTVKDGYLIKAKHTSNNCLDVEGGWYANGVKIMHGGCHGDANQVFSLKPKGEGQYLEMIARHSGKCVDVGNASSADGQQIIQHDCNGGGNQAFREEWWPNTSYTSYVAQHSQKCLDVTGGSTGWAPLQQWTCNGSDQQRFSLTPVDSGPIPTETTMEVDQVLHGSPGVVSFHGNLKAGPYSMANRVVHVEFDNAQVAGWSTLYDRTASANSEGYFEYRDYGIQPGYYNIRARFMGDGEFKASENPDPKNRTVKRGYQIISRKSGKCLSLSENKNVNGQRFLQWDCAPPSSNGQVYSFWEPQGGGWYQLRVNGTNRCLDVVNVSGENGAQLQLYDCLGGGQTNQHWKREQIQPQEQNQGWFGLMPRHTFRPDIPSYKCMDVQNQSLNNGALVWQWDCHWGWNQQWELRGVIDP
jgi:Ricin-type beta-trefoil lectin domain/Ricin-type beta-trefoil lectin domain-like